MEQELIVYPGWDKRNADPSKDYGIHGCEVVFYIHNKDRTQWVQFKCYTDWLPKKVQYDTLHDPITGRYKVVQEVVGEQPRGADLGYHSPTQRYAGQTRMKCDLSKQGFCFYDGSSWPANELRDLMLEKGSEGVWKELKKYYLEIFPEEVKVTK